MRNMCEGRTPMCAEVIQQLKDTGLFDDVDWNDLDNTYCYEIYYEGDWMRMAVPHDVYWSPNKASGVIGYTPAYLQSLCKNEEIHYYWYDNGYQINSKEIIRLRKRYLEHKKKHEK